MKLRKGKFRLLPDSEISIICEIIYLEHNEKLIYCEMY